jgi:oligopeptide/dipeptide ABC transporter ATP-binding protein
VDSDAPLLDVRDLHTRFATKAGPVHAVNGVSFTVADGELVGLVGETGCGKSVTARSILDLVTPPGRIESGEVRFRGRDLRAVDARARDAVRGTGMGFIPQNPWGALNPVFSIDRQFRNVLRAHDRKKSRRECHEIALEMLRRVGIGAPEWVLKGHAHQLSGGMAQRVVIALSLALGPDLVIADEPTTGLDVTIQRQVLDLIVEALRAEHRAMLLVTHDLGVVAQYCDRVIVMYAGRVVESGRVDEVFASPAHPYTAALIGSVPRPGRELVSLRGSVPNLVAYPDGCVFAARCPRVHDPCASVVPETTRRGDDHDYACHLPGGVTEHAAAAR